MSAYVEAVERPFGADVPRCYACHDDYFRSARNNRSLNSRRQPDHALLHMPREYTSKLRRLREAFLLALLAQ